MRLFVLFCPLLHPPTCCLFAVWCLGWSWMASIFTCLKRKTSRSTGSVQMGQVCSVTLKLSSLATRRTYVALFLSTPTSSVEEGELGEWRSPRRVAVKLKRFCVTPIQESILLRSVLMLDCVQLQLLPLLWFGCVLKKHLLQQWSGWVSCCWPYKVSSSLLNLCTCPQHCSVRTDWAGSPDWCAIFISFPFRVRVVRHCSDIQNCWLTSPAVVLSRELWSFLETSICWLDLTYVCGEGENCQALQYTCVFSK